VRGRLGYGPTFLGAMGLQGLTLLAATQASSIPVLAVLAALCCFGDFVGRVCNTSLRLELTPATMLGRVSAATWLLTVGMVPLGAVGATSVASRAARPSLSQRWAWSS